MTTLLQSNQCLIYLISAHPFAEVDTVTYIAQIKGQFEDKDIIWYEVEVLTSSTGDRIDIPQQITVPAAQIISNRLPRDIQPRCCYYFASRLLSGTMQYGIKATNFALSEVDDFPLAKTSNAGLGSGIYGQFIKNEASLSRYQASPTQDVYRIDVPAAYLLQDREHGDSLTIASLHTNRYLDDLIRILRSENRTSMAEIQASFQPGSLESLLRLWNIVFYRTNQFISMEWFRETLIQYLFQYQNQKELQDTLTGAPIQELPINLILRRLGHDGILGDDYHSNKWNRGCVSFNYEQATILQGNRAAYNY